MFNLVKLIKTVMVTFTLVFGIVCIISSSGGGGGGGQSDAEEEVPSKYLVYTNPSDGRLFEEIAGSGVSSTYVGTKDSDGTPLSLESIVVKDPGYDGEFVYVLSEDNQHERIFAPEGVFFEIERTSDTELRLKIVSDGGDLQFSFPIPLPAEETIMSAQTDNLSTLADATTPDTTFHLNVSQCGKPVENALITMAITPGVGKAAPVGRYVGDGRYAFDIPKLAELPASEEYLKKCKEIGKKVQEACGYWSMLEAAFTSANPCNDLDSAYAVARSALAIKYIFKPEKLEAIDAKFETIKKYCTPALIKLVPKICELHAVFDFGEICKENHFTFLEPDPNKVYSYTLDVTMAGNQAFSSEPVQFDPNNSYDMTLEAPPAISCEKIYTDPDDPKVTDGYTAKASMVCPDPVEGTEVTLSVSGSDGFETSLVDTMYADGEIEIDVSAVTDEDDIQSGVTDTIVVEAEDKTWSESASSPRNSLGTMDAGTAEASKSWILVVKKDAQDKDKDGYTTDGGDCNDADADIYPGASEVCDDGVDNDCDDASDCQDSDCALHDDCKGIETWYVWYVDNISLNPVMVGTNTAFAEERLCSSYPGGGMSSTTMMDKIAIVEGYQTKESAIQAACSQFTNIRPVPPSSTFVWTDWLADRGGERHDIDELGGCQ